jgi:hypothetical protein
MTTVTKENDLHMYLMWQPSLADSIAVPLRVANWKWSGAAAYTVSSGWSLTVSNFTAQAPVDTTAFPEWTNSILPGTWTTNSIP